jgi:hypothetical protein
MSERRYTDEEVAEIFRRATEAQPPERRQLAPVDGLTIAELQEIGRQAGIAPDQVARAALSMDRVGTRTRRSLLGFPIGVGTTVELGRTLTDAEWERLVGDLRETFDARGTVSRDGSLRQWSNGNLHVMLEPGQQGQRLRMRTFNARARMWIAAGLAYGVGAGAAAVISLLTGGLDSSTSTSVAFLGVAGVALFAAGAARLPGWARQRLAQMQGIGERLLAAAPPPPNDPAA